MDGAAGHLDLERGDAYGRSFGDVYDRWYHDVTDADATADFVLTRHRGGLVLELGVGTGRLARPLADRGLTVVGLDASPEMLAAGGNGVEEDEEEKKEEQQQQNAAGSRRIHPVLADMRALPFARFQGRRSSAFGSILIAFNTLFNLARADEQQDLLADLAHLVEAGGVIIVEMLDVSALLDGPDHSIGLRNSSTDRRREPFVVTATQLDRVAQRLSGQHVEVDDQGVRIRPWMLRWVTAAQLDTMAAAAGLELDERLGSWHGAPPTAQATTVISVYRPGSSTVGRCRT